MPVKYSDKALCAHFAGLHLLSGFIKILPFLSFQIRPHFRLFYVFPEIRPCFGRGKCFAHGTNVLK